MSLFGYTGLKISMWSYSILKNKTEQNKQNILVILFL